MLTNLEIKNGVLTPDFDIYNDVYSVFIEENVDVLDIIYELDENNISIQISGNENLNEGKKIVNIFVEDETIKKNIVLNIVRSNTKSTIGLQNYFDVLEIKKQEKMPEYIGPLIGAGCFLLIAITFTILFHKKRKKK